MVSSIGVNVEDDKGWNDKVKSIAIELALAISEMVKMCKCVGVWKVMCKSVEV